MHLTSPKVSCLITYTVKQAFSVVSLISLISFDNGLVITSFRHFEQHTEKPAILSSSTSHLYLTVNMPLVLLDYGYFDDILSAPQDKVLTERHIASDNPFPESNSI